MWPPEEAHPGVSPGQGQGGPRGWTPRPGSRSPAPAGGPGVLRAPGRRATQSSIKGSRRGHCSARPARSRGPERLRLPQQAALHLRQRLPAVGGIDVARPQEAVRVLAHQLGALLVALLPVPPRGRAPAGVAGAEVAEQEARSQRSSAARRPGRRERSGGGCPWTSSNISGTRIQRSAREGGGSSGRRSVPAGRRG